MPNAKSQTPKISAPQAPTLLDFGPLAFGVFRQIAIFGVSDPGYNGNRQKQFVSGLNRFSFAADQRSMEG